MYSSIVDFILDVAIVVSALAAVAIAYVGIKFIVSSL